MKLKTQDYYDIEVKFLVQDEEQVLNLKVNCMTPRKVNDYANKVNGRDDGFNVLVKCNCDVITDWEGVYDEDGNPVEYSPEKLTDLQLDYFGLADAIAITIFEESRRLREKNLGSSADLSK